MSNEYLHDSIYSPWSFPLDPPEQRKAEHERWRSLTKQQRHEEWLAFSAQCEKRRLDKENKPLKNSEANDEWMYINAESPNSIDDSVATIWWIIALVGGAIFKDRWLIWIFATLLWLGKIFRHEIRQWKWNHGGKEEYYQKIEDATKRR